MLACSLFKLSVALPCDPVHLKKRGPGAAGAVCRCNETYCDSIEPLGDIAPDEVVFYQTSLGNDTDRLSRHTTGYSNSTGGDWQEIALNASELHQSIIGFGGALTDAAAINFKQLSASVRKHVINSYYSDSGLEYSLGRIPIAACDFSTHVYSYDDIPSGTAAPDDLNLTHFSTAMDEASGKIALIKAALSATTASNRPLRLFGSPWQSPLWMTRKNSSLNAQLKGDPGGAYYRSFAKYVSRFVTEYKAQYGIEVWGVTVANEPSSKHGKWQDINLTPEQERDFLKKDLGPTLRADHPDLKIIMLDDQRTALPKWTSVVLGDADAAPYVDGIGVHWYAAVEDSTGHNPFDHVAAATAAHPGKFLIGTEACEGFLPWSQGVYPGDWDRAQTYAHDILGDVNAGAAGWTDWNILLDMNGGPNWANNVVDAPILADATAGTSTIYKQPMYYYLGHVTKFIPPGAKRVGLKSTGVPVVSAPMEATAFLLPAGAGSGSGSGRGNDGKGRMVVVVLNRDVSSHKFAIKHPDPARGYIRGDIPARAIQTYIFNA